MSPENVELLRKGYEWATTHREFGPKEMFDTLLEAGDRNRALEAAGLGE